MTDELIRKSDALYAIAGWDIPSTAIEALPAVTVGAIQIADEVFDFFEKKGADAEAFGAAEVGARLRQAALEPAAPDGYCWPCHYAGSCDKHPEDAALTSNLVDDSRPADPAINNLVGDAGPSESAVYDRTGLPPVTVAATRPAAIREAAIRECAEKLQRDWPGPAAAIILALIPKGAAE